MNDSVPIALKGRAHGAFRLGPHTAATPIRPAGIGRKHRHRGKVSAGGGFDKRAALLTLKESGPYPRGPQWSRMNEISPLKEVSLTPAAVRRIGELVAAEGDPSLMLRLAVSGGGCSGFQYGFSFDDTRNEDDALFERDGVKLVVDQTSLELLVGAEVDFVEDLVGASFQVRNPNATSSCGCGSSFSI
jgi:iron-sulfur cluster insertion protein